MRNKMFLFVLLRTFLSLLLPLELEGAATGNQIVYKVDIDHFLEQEQNVDDNTDHSNDNESEEWTLQNLHPNSIPQTFSPGEKVNNHVKIDQERSRPLGSGSLPVTQPDPNNKTYTPLVYWHGMGDCGWNVKRALSFIEDELPGVYVKSIQIGATIPEDIENSYFFNVNTQVELVCAMIKNDSRLQGGYNGIGLSQGGQFLRAVAQRCPEPRMINLISLGGQHQGVFGLPKCSAPKKEWCEIIDKLLTHVAYAGWVQKFLVQAEYWHDPFKNADYVAKSVFLADINNERGINMEYKNNLQKLDNLVLVRFDQESIVQPSESEWFGYFEVGSDKTMVAMENTTLYTEDRLGLKAMKEAGKLHLLSSPGDHLQFTREWFDTNILKPFLSK